jgi:hypothetical protein
MFDLFKKKENRQIEPTVYYYVHIDECKTVAQLREAMKMVMRAINRQNDGTFVIKEENLSKYPALRKIVKKGAPPK